MLLVTHLIADGTGPMVQTVVLLSVAGNLRVGSLILVLALGLLHRHRSICRMRPIVCREREVAGVVGEVRIAYARVVPVLVERRPDLDNDGARLSGPGDTRLTVLIILVEGEKEAVFTFLEVIIHVIFVCIDTVEVLDGLAMRLAAYDR